MNRVLLLHADDWVVLYVDGKSIFQAHRIGPMDLLELAGKHSFSHADVLSKWATEEDETECNEVGNFPESQSELKGSYN